MADDNDGPNSSRRDYLKGLGAVGAAALLSTGAAEAQAGVGGGPASDEMADLRQVLYGGPLGDRADAGVDGRVYWADDGTIARDDGGSWTKPDLQGLGSVGTEEANITPLKVGYWTDAHWGNSSNASFVSQSSLEGKIDTFASDMNFWGADYVILGGDNAHEDTGNQSGSLQRHQNFYDYMRSALDNSITIRTLAGNHEHYNASSWGDTWWGSPYGVSSLSDTYYSIDHHHAKLIGLNTGYSGDDSLDSGVPSAQYSWFKSELETTEKPVVVFTHTPIPPGTHSGYDSLGPADEQKYAHLIDQHDHVEIVTFGHCHHLSNFGRSPTFEKSMLQQWGQTRYFFQHFPHGVGNTSETFDNNVTPYGKLHIYQDGHIWIQQSYADDGTGYQTDWRFSGNVDPKAEDRWNSLSWEYTDAVQSLDGYDVSTVGASSSATINTGVGEPHYLLKTDSSAAGDNANIVYRRRPSILVSNDGLDWADMVMNVVVEVDDMTDFRGHIGRGKNASGNKSFVGLYLNNGSMWLWTSDGTDFQTSDATLPAPTGGATHYQVRMSHELGRAEVSVNHNTENGAWYCDTNVPSIDNADNSGDPKDHLYLFNALAQTKTTAAKAMRIYDWNIKLAPHLAWDL